MPFQNGVFKRVYSWVQEAAGGNGIDPAKVDKDMDDMAAGLSGAILRDGTGKPTADIPWNGKRLTGLGAPIAVGDALAQGLLPQAEVVRALGFTPVQQGTGVAQNTSLVKLGWSTAGVLRCTIDTASDQGKVWLDSTTTAADISGKLGYVPARPSGSFGGTTGDQADVPVGASFRGYYMTLDFTATAQTVFGMVAASILNTTPGSGTVTAYLGCDLLDVATNTVVTGGNEAPAGSNYGNGYKHLASFLVFSGLVLGRNYRMRLYLYKDTSTAACAAINLSLKGIVV